MTGEARGYTVDDLRAAVKSGDADPQLAEAVIAAMERGGFKTVGEMNGYNTGIIAEWAAKQPGGVQVGGADVKPIDVPAAVVDELLSGEDADE